jgi:hypothetical protein
MKELLERSVDDDDDGDETGKLSSSSRKKNFGKVFFECE